VSKFLLPGGEQRAQTYAMACYRQQRNVTDVCRSRRYTSFVLKQRLFILVLFAHGALNCVVVHGQNPIWAKAAVPFNFNCVEKSTNSQQISSPDGHVTVEVKCRAKSAETDPTYYLHVTERNGVTRDVDLEDGAHELLWSPDSKAFFVNSGQSAYAGFSTTVYEVSDDGTRRLAITGAAQRDMVASFPPCKAYYHDQNLCKKIAANPEYNMSAVSWLNDSSAVVVMAEVPCSSNYGGIMCQVLGYEIAVPTGKILRRMSATEFKRDWQHSMAWDMRIPDPPTYGEPYPEH
jgi:hypothetical protein